MVATRSSLSIGYPIGARDMRPHCTAAKSPSTCREGRFTYSTALQVSGTCIALRVTWATAWPDAPDSMRWACRPSPRPSEAGTDAGSAYRRFERPRTPDMPEVCTDARSVYRCSLLAKLPGCLPANALSDLHLLGSQSPPGPKKVHTSGSGTHFRQTCRAPGVRRPACTAPPRPAHSPPARAGSSA